jgi:hypothetical protein
VQCGIEKVNERIQTEEEQVKENFGVRFLKDASCHGIEGTRGSRLGDKRGGRGRGLLLVSLGFLWRGIVRVENRSKERITLILNKLCWVYRLCLVDVVFSILGVISRALRTGGVRVPVLINRGS